jgi:hypothetical protein
MSGPAAAAISGRIALLAPDRALLALMVGAAHFLQAH